MKEKIKKLKERVRTNEREIKKYGNENQNIIKSMVDEVETRTKQFINFEPIY